MPDIRAIREAVRGVPQNQWQPDVCLHSQSGGDVSDEPRMCGAVSPARIRPPNTGFTACNCGCVKDHGHDGSHSPIEK